VSAVWSPAFALIVSPADDVIEVCLLADLLKIRGKRAADLVFLVADRVAGQTDARFKQIFSVRDITTLLLGEFAFETVLPEVRSNRLDLFLTIFVAHRRHAVLNGLGETPEGRHLGTG